MLKLIFALIAVAVAVPAGGLLAGVDRRLTARLQSRQGPPLLQPFYEVILTFVGMSAATGSFMISDIYALDVPLLPHLPFLFIALGYALTIKLAKSPFDIASCHHGHQEIVRGVLTDYSGPQLALLEISHWLDVILLLGLCSLFWHTSITGMVVLLVLTYALEIVVDNVCARMTWGWMLKHAFGITLGLAIFNILWLYVR